MEELAVGATKNRTVCRKPLVVLSLQRAKPLEIPPDRLPAHRHGFQQKELGADGMKDSQSPRAMRMVMAKEVPKPKGVAVLEW